VLGATRDAAVLAADRGLRAAWLEAIKHCIVRSSDGLTIHSVAAQFHVTPRSVQRLFEAEGTTFSHFMLDQRLARAHRLLKDPRCAGWTVSAIAFEVGIGVTSSAHQGKGVPARFLRPASSTTISTASRRSTGARGSRGR
jgi:AraC-like DNA-binding protein